MPQKVPAAKFASPGDAQERNDIQIKFLYYSLIPDPNLDKKGIRLLETVPSLEKYMFFYRKSIFSWASILEIGLAFS